MTQQVIGIGTVANDGTGDPARTAFGKVNTNFTELFPSIASVTADTVLTAATSLTLVNATSGAKSITLPTAATGKEATIKKTDSSVNTVTVLPNGSETIDGDASVIISYQYTAVKLLSDGSNWHMA